MEGGRGRRKVTHPASLGISCKKWVLSFVSIGGGKGETTHQLLRGWQPQKEMFFIWKKWLQRSNWNETEESDWEVVRQVFLEISLPCPAYLITWLTSREEA